MWTKQLHICGIIQDHLLQVCYTDLLLHSLLGVYIRDLSLTQHHPVLVAVLRHLLPTFVHRLHLRVAVKDLRHASLPG